jgi:hypothetical protein
MKSQVVPSHDVELAPVGLGHDVQSVVPHESVLVFDKQTMEQLCVAGGQMPSHDAAWSMHFPAHSFIAPGHEGTHAVPSQVTLPPIGIWQAEHDVVPQLPTSLLLTHLAPQMWKPVLQTRPQLPPTHCAVPFGSVAHTVQAIPQAVASVSRLQRAPHL